MPLTSKNTKILPSFPLPLLRLHLIKGKLTDVCHIKKTNSPFYKILPSNKSSFFFVGRSYHKPALFSVKRRLKDCAILIMYIRLIFVPLVWQSVVLWCSLGGKNIYFYRRWIMLDTNLNYTFNYLILPN